MSPPAKRERPKAVSDVIILEAIKIAEMRDLSKGSCTSTADVIEIVDGLRHQELEQMGRNPLAPLPQLNYSKMRGIALEVAPVAVLNGSIQNESRKRALCDPRNAISCAAVWTAVAADITNGKFIHSWVEVVVELNKFKQKQKLRCTIKGRKKLAVRNVTPATTGKQEKRRMLKRGLSELKIALTYNRESRFTTYSSKLMHFIIQIHMHMVYWNAQ